MHVNYVYDGRILISLTGRSDSIFVNRNIFHILHSGNFSSSTDSIPVSNDAI